MFGGMLRYSAGSPAIASRTSLARIAVPFTVATTGSGGPAGAGAGAGAGVVCASAVPQRQASTPRTVKLKLRMGDPYLSRRDVWRNRTGATSRAGAPSLTGSGAAPI